MNRTRSTRILIATLATLGVFALGATPASAQSLYTPAEGECVAYVTWSTSTDRASIYDASGGCASMGIQHSYYLQGSPGITIWTGFYTSGLFAQTPVRPQLNGLYYTWSD